MKICDELVIEEEFTRYQVYMQVKKDISEGRLNAPLSTICLLTSFVVQSTIGDFDPDTCGSGYLIPYYDLRRHSQDQNNSENSSLGQNSSSVETLPDEEMDRRISELHKLHKGRESNKFRVKLNFQYVVFGLFKFLVLATRLFISYQ